MPLFVQNMTQRRDVRAPKGSESACAYGTNNHGPRNRRQGVSAEEIVEVAVFWTLRLLGKLFQGMYSPEGRGERAHARRVDEDIHEQDMPGA